MSVSASVFKTAIDIANRAIQWCKTRRIEAFTDDSEQAAESGFAYDKVRQAELRRNVWTFAVRRATLYPINTIQQAETFDQEIGYDPGAPDFDNFHQWPTLMLVPRLWSTGVVYGASSIVQDATGHWWVSVRDFNVGNTPGQSTDTWDTYFGSKCVQPFDWKPYPVKGEYRTAYFAGDLVYRANKQGSVQVFASMHNGNENDPLCPEVYTATRTYKVGSVVQDAQGWFWQSTISLNKGNQPGVYGPWSSVPTYAIGALVIGSDKVLYQALVSTTNVNPANAANPTDWLKIGYPGSWPVYNSDIIYGLGDIIAGNDGKLYQSLQANNTGNQPVGSTYNPNMPTTNWWMGINLYNPWIACFGTTTAGHGWQALDCGVENININYPVGTGPSCQETTRNVFLLPCGYLRTAPQEPKQGSVSFLGAPTGLMYQDWEFDGPYLISRTPYPIKFRFVADITVVDKMDTMFCEGLACRLAVAIAGRLSQSDADLTAVERAYSQFMGDARLINAIEQGATEPAEDDFLTCRI